MSRPSGLPGLTAVQEAVRHGRVGSFLLTSLRKAGNRYMSAVDNFNNDVLAQRGVPFSALDEADQDYTMADRVVELCELSGFSEGYAAAACLIAGVCKINPRGSYCTWCAGGASGI